MFFRSAYYSDASTTEAASIRRNPSASGSLVCCSRSHTIVPAIDTTIGKETYRMTVYSMTACKSALATRNDICDCPALHQVDPENPTSCWTVVIRPARMNAGIAAD
jgi:hypothetical protein